VMILHAGTSGALDDLDTKLVLDFERELLAYMSDVHPEVGESLRTTKVMSDETKATLDAAVTKIKAQVAAK
jgi:F-type H+/Na+-transporting ATPase subunit alpha